MEAIVSSELSKRFHVELLFYFPQSCMLGAREAMTRALAKLGSKMTLLGPG